MNPKIQIKDSITLITGANRGIGKSIVETLLDRGAAKIYAAVRDPASAQPLVDTFGDRIIPIEVDLTRPESIKAAAEQASDCTIVINNAGILLTSSPFDESVFSNFEKEMNVNVLGLLHMARSFAPVLKENGGGAFVQLNSVASLRSFAAFSSYCASKAAAYSFTLAIRDELASQNTLVVSVHPGPIDTDMAHNAGIAEMAEPPSLVAEATVEALENGRFHVFPDTMAKQFESAYQPFAQAYVEANVTEA